MTKHIVQDYEVLRSFLRDANPLALAVDTETTGFIVNDGYIAGWGIGDDKNQIYVPVRHTEYALTNSLGYKNLDFEKVNDIIGDFFDEYEGHLLFHEAKFDMQMIVKDFFKHDRHKMMLEFWKDKKFHDTKILAHLLNENRSNSLKPLTDQLFGYSATEKEELDKRLSVIKAERKKVFKDQFYIGKDPENKRKKLWKPGKDAAIKKWEKQYKKNYAEAEIPLVGKYCCDDVKRTFELFSYLSNEIQEPYNESIKEAYRQEHDLILTIGAMELRGLRVDYKYFQDKQVEIEQDIYQKVNNLYGMAGKQYNVNSGQQVAGILKGMGLSLPETDKGNPSTSKLTLQRLQKTSSPEASCFIDEHLSYQHMDKILSTYIEPILACSKRDSVVRGRFNQTGTVTGRFSSTEPNLQNVPKKDKTIRSGYIPRDGFCNIYFDYVQMEMRLAAHYSKDPNLIKLIQDGIDPYKYLAAIGENIRYEDVPPSVRNEYKTVGLALLYGAGETRLLLMTSRAKQIIKIFYETFQQIKELERHLYSQVEAQGHITLFSGRKRRLAPCDSYKALNSLIQGSGAMMIKKAMIGISELLEEYHSSIILQVHDELGVETKKEEIFLIPFVKNIMEDFDTIVPMDVDVEIAAPNWAEKERWLA